MSIARSFLKYWLPVAAWMALIFTASSDSHSFARSSRILGPLLHWLFPGMPEQSVNTVVLFARKGAHLTEYGILSLLLWRAVRKSDPRAPRPWSWREVRVTILLVALYASTDEFHQLFVPSRDAAVHDVLIDTTGGTAGLLALWLVTRGKPHAELPPPAAETQPGK